MGSFRGHEILSTSLTHLKTPEAETRHYRALIRTRRLELLLEDHGGINPRIAEEGDCQVAGCASLSILAVVA